MSPLQESKDNLSDQQNTHRCTTENSTSAGDHLPNSSRSSSSNSIGSPPTQNADSEDMGPVPEQEHPPERRYSQALIEELSSQLTAPKPVDMALQDASTSAGEPSTHSPHPASPPTSLPRALREIAALSSLPSYALPLLEMGFSRRHVIQAMVATGTKERADARRINMLVTWLLEHPVSDDGVSNVWFSLLTEWDGCIGKYLVQVQDKQTKHIEVLASRLRAN